MTNRRLTALQQLQHAENRHFNAKARCSHDGKEDHECCQQLRMARSGRTDALRNYHQQRGK